jgi:anti-anti-sigma factor
MKIFKSRHQGTWVVRLVGPLVHGKGVLQLHQALEPLKKHGYRRYVLDLSATTFIDAAGIGEIVGLDRQMRLRGGRLVLAAASARIKAALALTGLTGVLTLTERLGDGLRLARSSAARAVAGRVGELVGEVRKSPAIIRRTAEGSCRFIPIPG